MCVCAKATCYVFVTGSDVLYPEFMDDMSHKFVSKSYVFSVCISG